MVLDRTSALAREYRRSQHFARVLQDFTRSCGEFLLNASMVGSWASFSGIRATHAHDEWTLLAMSFSTSSSIMRTVHL